MSLPSITKSKPGHNAAVKSDPDKNQDQRQYAFNLTYTDRSSEVIENITTSDENALSLYRQDSICGPFPLKLSIVLKITEKLGLQHVISWLPHGRSFIIHRPREFEEKVMGKFFKQTKFTSFRRQLNLYDFRRISHGRDVGSYYHEMFLRGRPLLAKKMVRRKVKGTQLAASSAIDVEPNFYAMTFMRSTSDYPSDEYCSRGNFPMNQDPMHGAAGNFLMNQDPMNGIGGNYSSFLNLQRANNNNSNLARSLVLPGSFNMGGALNRHDQFSNYQNPCEQPHLLGSTPTQQNPLYSDFVNLQLANRMQLPQSYAGSIDNVKYANHLAESTRFQRNNVALSLAMAENDRIAAEARLNLNLPSFKNNAAILESMAGMRGLHSAVRRDPALSYANPGNVDSLPYV